MSTRPDWLQTFTDAICACLCAVEEMPPIGCHVIRVSDTWEVTLFLSSTEIVGGPHDGERFSCLFVVDVLEMLQKFDVIESIGWQPHALNEQDELRAHFSVTGYVNGHAIWLRVLADPPDRFKPGRYADLNEKRFLETWLG